MASNSQPSVAFNTSRTMREGVRVGPEGTLRRPSWPEAIIFTLVPPTSSIRIFFMENSFAYRNPNSWNEKNDERRPRQSGRGWRQQRVRGELDGTCRDTQESNEEP